MDTIATVPSEEFLSRLQQYSENVFGQEKRPGAPSLWAEVIDIRLQSKYSEKHVRHAVNVSIPSTLLRRPKFGISNILSSIPDGQRLQSWKDSDALFIYDAGISGAARLRALALKFVRAGYTKPIYILNSGFESLDRCAPELMISSESERSLFESQFGTMLSLSTPTSTVPSGNVSGCTSSSSLASVITKPFSISSTQTVLSDKQATDVDSIFSAPILLDHKSTNLATSDSTSSEQSGYFPAASETHVTPSRPSRPSLKTRLSYPQQSPRSAAAKSKRLENVKALKCLHQYKSAPDVKALFNNPKMSRRAPAESHETGERPAQREKRSIAPASFSHRLSSRRQPPPLRLNLDKMQCTQQKKLPSHFICALPKDGVSNPWGSVKRATPPPDDMLSDMNTASIYYKFKRLEEQDLLRMAQMNDQQSEWSCIESGKTSELACRNRYADIVPYDRTRVKIPSRDPTSDYINASHITLGTDRYIACQAPKESTVLDFWEMIWFSIDKVGTVVKLANVVEGGRERCTQYWPTAIDQPLMIDPRSGFIIELFEHTELPDLNAIMNVFYMKRNNCAPKCVYQICYVAWPDHGAPEDTKCVVDFTRLVNQFERDGPLIVHCSAGVGRTGTFIAIDHLMHLSSQQLPDSAVVRDEEDVVFQTVNLLRSQRMKMVQNFKQFRFVYDIAQYLRAQN
ncbi:tyrosine phosphatase Pyp2 [Schizosaccharomyces japonicus yFS275]|uniref:protein-tyrosine-phosphatase n=1 Tax=Schizosaccharomyces japonicus (strain yFS275 / FY16936) TaxID=402676 RepID=B6JZG2_SCHJY|nr:tyrosine phosphatase Pyp2 [Schizosaccharomyces japonicus yFS275]EEB06930.1 tyrosine phosphatase Pyp2 [Schizosaccharomyces japonicus yFS275]